MANIEKNIIIIDDQESILNGLKHTFIKEGFNVDTASNVKNALNLINSKIYNFIISDLRMPELSGMDLVKQLFEKKYPAKIILISAYFSLEDAIQALRYGVSDLFSKPFKTNDILKRINDLSTNFISDNNYSVGFGYKCLRGIDKYFHSLNFYNNLESWKYLSIDYSESIYRVCLCYNIDDQVSNHLFGAFLSLNSLNYDFDKIIEFLKNDRYFSFLNVNEKSVVLLEYNFNTKNLKYYCPKNVSLMVIYPYSSSPENKLIINDTGELRLLDNWIFIVNELNDNQVDELKANNNLNNSKELKPDKGWVNINENYIKSLVKKINKPLIGKPKIVFYDPKNSTYLKTFNFKIDCSVLDINNILNSILSPLEIMTSNVYIIGDILSFTMNVISNLKNVNLLEINLFKESSKIIIELKAQDLNELYNKSLEDNDILKSGLQLNEDDIYLDFQKEDYFTKLNNKIKRQEYEDKICYEVLV